METVLRTHNNKSEKFNISFDPKTHQLTIQDTTYQYVSVNLEDLLEDLDALSLNEDGCVLSDILTQWSIHRL